MRAEGPRSGTRPGRAGLAGVVVALAVLAAPAAAKFGLDDLDRDERERLARLTDELAQTEAIFAVCAAPQDYGRRLREQVERCIEDDAIERVQGFYRQRYEFYLRAVQPEGCKTPAVQNNLPHIKLQMEKVLEQIGLLCRFCLFC